MRLAPASRGVKAVAASVEGNARRGDGGVVRVHGLEAAWPEIKGWKLREGQSSQLTTTRPAPTWRS